VACDSAHARAINKARRDGGGPAEVRPAGSSAAIEGLSLAEADPVRGNYVRPGALVSWCGGGSPWRALAGQQVALRVAMADSQLYSLEWGCG